MNDCVLWIDGSDSTTLYASQNDFTNKTPVSANNAAVKYIAHRLQRHGAGA